MALGKAWHKSWYGAGLALALLALPLQARDLIKLAELPPPDYRGQQYVDSKGCLFMRAGPAGQTVWIPRVTRDGVPLCGNPPSGKRVPLVREAEFGAAPPPAENTADNPAGSPVAKAVAGGYLVAVGSFAVTANADRAVARLRSLGYPVALAPLRGKKGPMVTVLAGPFDTAALAATAQDALRGAGFPEATVLAP